MPSLACSEPQLKRKVSPSHYFLKIISYEALNIYVVHLERRQDGLEICCVFTKSIVFKQQIYFSFLRKTGVEVGVKKLVIFCRCHNCMITNVKKVMVLVMFLVQVLQ